MTYPFRRRPPRFYGDFPDDGEAVTEAISLIPAWDRRRDPRWYGDLGGASVAGLPDWQHSRLTPPPPARPAIPAPPAPRRFTAPVTVVAVTVGDGTGAGDAGSVRMHAALTYIRLKVAIMEAAGRARRIDEAEHARRRGDEIAPRSAVGEIRREAAALLLGTGAP